MELSVGVHQRAAGISPTTNTVSLIMGLAASQGSLPAWMAAVFEPSGDVTMTTIVEMEVTS